MCNEPIPILICTECLNYSHKTGVCRLGRSIFTAQCCADFEFPDRRLPQSSQGTTYAAEVHYPAGLFAQASLLEFEEAK